MIPTDYTCTNALKLLKILIYHKMGLFYNLILQSLSNKHRHLIKLMQDSWLSSKQSNNQNIILLGFPGGTVARVLSLISGRELDPTCHN